MRKISVNQLTTMQWSFDEDVVFYRSRGIKRIGVCQSKVSDFGIEKCRELLADAGMTVSSYGSVTLSGGMTGPTLKEQLRDARQEIENAAFLEAPQLIFHTGGQAGHLRKNRFCIARQALDQLLPTAEEYGVLLAIEPFSADGTAMSRFSHPLEDAIELVDAYASENLTLALDLFHVGHDLLELSPAWFSEHVSLVQLADFVWQSNRKLRAPMGCGELRLDDVCDYLEQTGFQGAFEFELYGEQFDLVSYQETISAIADTLTITPTAPVEFESIKV